MAVAEELNYRRAAQRLFVAYLEALWLFVVAYQASASIPGTTGCEGVSSPRAAAKRW